MVYFMYDELVLFIKIVKYGNIAVVSRLTGISPSNIIKKIHKYEKDLNIILLKRKTNNLELTDEGHELYDKFCHLETEYDKAVTKIEHKTQIPSGEINVLFPPFFALKIITAYICNFLLQYPKITLNISYQNSKTNLIKDNFDLAIINHLPLKHKKNIKLLCRGKILFYCYPDYIEKYGLPQNKEQLEDTVILGLDLDHKLADKITYLINRNTGKRQVFRHKYRLFQNSGSHDQEFIHSGKTIGVGMDLMLKNDIQNKLIIHVLPEFYLTGFNYYLLINQKVQNTRIQVFIEFINDCINRLDLNEKLELKF